MNYYRITVTDIKLHTWWVVAKHLPHLSKKISSLMSVLMGSEPIKLHGNFDSKYCRLCCSRTIESVMNILFGCPQLGATRYCLPNNITEAMPDGMRDSFSEMIVENKLIFLLAAMHCCYTKDWGNLYRSIVIFVDKMYSERSAKYKALEMS